MTKGGSSLPSSRCDGFGVGGVWGFGGGGVYLVEPTIASQVML